MTTVPTTKPASDLHPGDCIDVKHDKPREVLHVQPYTDGNGGPCVAVLVGRTPVPLYFQAAEKVRLVSGDVKDRTAVVDAMRELADLIEKHALPVPIRAGVLDFPMRDLGEVDAVSEALGVPIQVDSVGRHEVLWPEGRKFASQGVVASFFVYVKDDKADGS